MWLYKNYQCQCQHHYQHLNIHCHKPPQYLHPEKRDINPHGYIPMTVTGENRYCPGKEILRVTDIAQWPWRGENRYSHGMNPTCHKYRPMTVTGGRLILAVKGKPMRHEYGPMTLIRLRAYILSCWSRCLAFSTYTPSPPL